eukprot:88074-Pelagomonas_calceolata.AAC.5
MKRILICSSFNFAIDARHNQEVECSKVQQQVLTLSSGTPHAVTLLEAWVDFLGLCPNVPVYQTHACAWSRLFVVHPDPPPTKLLQDCQATEGCR